jgi:hypothetical protein
VALRWSREVLEWWARDDDPFRDPKRNLPGAIHYEINGVEVDEDAFSLAWVQLGVAVDHEAWRRGLRTPASS